LAIEAQTKRIPEPCGKSGFCSIGQVFENRMSIGDIKIAGCVKGQPSRLRRSETQNYSQAGNSQRRKCQICRPV
jgi:hypothetical protein